MRGVCGKQHLKTLVTHWLNHANLQLVAGGASPWPPAVDIRQRGSNDTAFSMGKVVGELAVQRETLSQVWTGSPEARECILSALIGDITEYPAAPVFPVAERATGYSAEYALP